MDTIKKPLGRRKIPIQKIQKKSDLKVAFSKRRSGLFKKASELAVLCSAQIGILVESPGGKIFTYGHPSVESVIHQFQSGQASSTDLGDNNEMQRRKYMEVERKLEREKEEERKIKENGMNGFWFIDDTLEDDEEEIGDHLEAIETLRENVLGRIQKMEKPATPPSVEAVGDETAVAGQYTAAPEEHCSNNFAFVGNSM